MIPLSIPLPTDDPSIEEFLSPSAGSAAADADLGPTSIYLETLTQAMESPNGIAVTCGTERSAIAMRHRLYKVRKKAISGGNTTFHRITISIVAAAGHYELHLKKIPFKTREL